MTDDSTLGGHIQVKTVILLSLAQIFSGLGAGAVVSTGSLLAVEMTGAPAWAGSITTASTLGGAVASTLLARLARARGRRIALSTGFLIATVGSMGMILSAVVNAFPLLLVSGLLIGFGQAVNLQARFAATDLASNKHRARDLSLVVWMSTVGAVAGPNMIGPGEVVATRIGIPALSGLFVFSSLGMLAAMAVIWVGLRPDPYLLSLQLKNRTTKQNRGPDRRGSFVEGVKIAWRIPDARCALVGILTAHAVMVALMSMTPVYMIGYGASIRLVGLTVSLHIGGMYAFAPIMGILTDRLGARQMVLGGLGVMLVSTGLAAGSYGNIILTILALVLLGVGWSAASVAGSAGLTVAVPTSTRLTVQGSADALMGLAGGAGGASAGVFLALMGFTGLSLVGAAAVVGAGALVAFTRRR